MRKDLIGEFNMTSSNGDIIRTIQQKAWYIYIYIYIYMCVCVCVCVCVCTYRDLLNTAIQKDSYFLKITTTQK